MTAFCPELPLNFGAAEGYVPIKTIVGLVRQNFKNLMLTVPGERVMDINFGVGLPRLLFEPKTFETKNTIIARINEQTRLYMPFITVKSISFPGFETNPNVLAVSVKYFIVPISFDDGLDLIL